MRTVPCRVPSHRAAHHLAGTLAATTCDRIARSIERSSALALVVAAAPGPAPSFPDSLAVVDVALPAVLSEVTASGSGAYVGGPDDGSTTSRELVDRVRSLGGYAEVVDVGEGGVEHYVAVVDDTTVVDLRARRFDASAPYPLVTDVDEYRFSELRGAIADRPSAPVDLPWARRLGRPEDGGPAYGADVEPHGWYVTEADPLGTYPSHSYQLGRSRFESPLYLEFGGDYSDPSNWKHRLSRYYGGLAGRGLSEALRRDGYDAVVTYDEHGTSEVVDMVDLLFD